MANLGMAFRVQLPTTRLWPWAAHALIQSDYQIASLFCPSSFFRAVAATLLLKDLRATPITAALVVTAFQTCPLLKELDVGECTKFDALKLARRLKEVPRESLVVGRLQKLEICETGKGASWVGYRQHLCTYTNSLERGYQRMTQQWGRSYSFGKPILDKGFQKRPARFPPSPTDSRRH